MSLKEYYGSNEKEALSKVYGEKRRKARETLIRAVASVFSSQFGFKNKTSGTVEEIVKDLRHHLPISEKLSKSKEVLRKSCVKIGEVFNKYFGSDFINLNADNLCQEVSDKIYSLTVQANGEYYDLLANATTLIKNLKSVSEGLKHNYNVFEKDIKNPLARDFHIRALKAIDNMADTLQLMVTENRDNDFVEDLKRSKQIKKYFEDFDGKINLGLSKIFDTTYTFTNVMKKVEKLAKKLGVTVADIKRIAKSVNPVKDLAEELADKLSHNSTPEFEEYLKSYNSLREILTDKNYRMVLGRKEFKREIEEGDKKFENTVKLFYDSLNLKFDMLSLQFNKVLEEVKAGKLYINEKHLYKMGDIEMKKFGSNTVDWYAQICGAKNEAEDINIRYEFTSNIRKLIEFFELFNNKATEKLINICEDILELIDLFNKKFGVMRGQVKIGYGVSDTLSKGYNKVKTVIKNIDNTISDLKSGGSQTNIIKKLEEFKDKLPYLVRKSNLIQRFKTTFESETEKYKDYSKIQARNIAKLKDVYTKRYNNILSDETKCYNTVTSSKPFSKEQKKLATLLYKNIINFIETVESIDIYYQQFFMNIVSNPENIKTLMSDITTDIYINDIEIMDLPKVEIKNNDPEEEYLTALQSIKEWGEKNSHLKSLISIFSKISDTFNGESIFDKTFKYPDQIYESIIEFMVFSNMKFSIGEITEKYGILNALLLDNYSTTSAYKTNPITDMTGDLGSLYQNVIKSFLGKILVSIDIYNLVNSDSSAVEINIFAPSRMITGGLENIKVNEDLIEIYVRIPLLVKLYKAIITNSGGKTNIDNIFSADIVFTDKIGINLAKQDFLKKFYRSCLDTVKTKNTVIDIISCCNELYDKFKSTKDPCLEIMKFISNDINLKIGYNFVSKINKVGVFKIMQNIDTEIFQNKSEISGIPPSEEYSSVGPLLNKTIENLSNKDISNLYLSMFNYIKTETVGFSDGEITIYKLISSIKSNFSRMENNEKLDYLVNILNESFDLYFNVDEVLFEQEIKKLPEKVINMNIDKILAYNNSLNGVAFDPLNFDYTDKYLSVNNDIIDTYVSNICIGSTTIITNINYGKTLNYDNYSKEFKNFIADLSNATSPEKMKYLKKLYPTNKKFIDYVYKQKFVSGGKDLLKRVHVKQGGGFAKMLEPPKGYGYEHWFIFDKTSIFRQSYTRTKEPKMKIVSDMLRFYLFELFCLNDISDKNHILVENIKNKINNLGNVFSGMVEIVGKAKLDDKDYNGIASRRIEKYVEFGNEFTITKTGVIFADEDIKSMYEFIDALRSNYKDVNDNVCKLFSDLIEDMYIWTNYFGDYDNITFPQNQGDNLDDNVYAIEPSIGETYNFQKDMEESSDTGAGSSSSPNIVPKSNELGTTTTNLFGDSDSGGNGGNGGDGGDGGDGGSDGDGGNGGGGGSSGDGGGGSLPKSEKPEDILNKITPDSNISFIDDGNYLEVNKSHPNIINIMTVYLNANRSTVFYIEAKKIYRKKHSVNDCSFEEVYKDISKSISCNYFTGNGDLKVSLKYDSVCFTLKVKMETIRNCLFSLNSDDMIKYKSNHGLSAKPRIDDINDLTFYENINDFDVFLKSDSLFENCKKFGDVKDVILQKYNDVFNPKINKDDVTYKTYKTLLKHIENKNTKSISYICELFGSTFDFAKSYTDKNNKEIEKNIWQENKKLINDITANQNIKNIKIKDDFNEIKKILTAYSEEKDQKDYMIEDSILHFHNKVVIATYNYVIRTIFAKLSKMNPSVIDTEQKNIENAIKELKALCTHIDAYLQRNNDDMLTNFGEELISIKNLYDRNTILEFIFQFIKDEQLGEFLIKAWNLEKTSNIESQLKAFIKAVKEKKSPASNSVDDLQNMMLDKRKEMQKSVGVGLNPLQAERMDYYHQMMPQLLTQIKDILNKPTPPTPTPTPTTYSKSTMAIDKTTLLNYITDFLTSNKITLSFEQNMNADNANNGLLLTLFTPSNNSISPDVNIDYPEFVFQYNGLLNYNISKSKFICDLSDFDNMVEHHSKVFGASEKMRTYISATNNNNLMNNLSKKTEDNMNLIKTNLTNYFANYKLENIKQQFNELYGKYLKRTSDKRSEQVNVTSFKVNRVFYSKLIDPILSNNLSYDIYEAKSSILNDTLLTTLRNNILKYPESKVGERRNIVENWELLSEYHKSKIIRFLQISFDELVQFNKKINFFKDIANYGDFTDITVLNKISNLLMVTIEAVKTVISEINDKPVAGEPDKGYIKSFYDINKHNPFLPYSSIIPMFTNLNPDSSLYYSARAVFLNKVDRTSFPFIYDVIEKYNNLGFKKYLTEDLIKNISNTNCLIKDIYLSNLATGFLILNDAEYEVWDFYHSVKPQKRSATTDTIFYANLNFTKNNKTKYHQTYNFYKSFTPDISDPAEDKCQENFYKFMNTNIVMDILENSRKNISIQRYLKEVGKTAPGNISMWSNIFEKNFMPLSLKSLYKSVLFSNVQLLSAVYEYDKSFYTTKITASNTVSAYGSTKTNERTITGNTDLNFATHNNDYYNIIKNYIQRYYKTNKNKLSSIELLSSTNRSNINNYNNKEPRKYSRTQIYYN